MKLDDARHRNCKLHIPQDHRIPALPAFQATTICPAVGQTGSGACSLLSSAKLPQIRVHAQHRANRPTEPGHAMVQLPHRMFEFFQRAVRPLRSVVPAIFQTPAPLRCDTIAGAGADA